MLAENEIAQAFYKGKLDKEDIKAEKYKIKVPLLMEEQIMKYQGITIHKSPYANTWYARYRANGKQHFISAKTQKECYNKLKSALKQVNKDKQAIELTTTQIKQITLKEWYEIWLNTYKKQKVRESTFKQIKLLFKNHILNNEIANLRLNEIKPLTIENFLNNIQFDRVKENVYTYLKDMLNKAILNEYINKNPLEHIEKPKYDKKPGNALTTTQQIEFEKEALKNPNYYIYLICLWQVLRIGELRALEKQDFDFVNKEITINKSISDVSKDNRTKNKHSNRIMPMFEKTYNLMQNYAFDKDRLTRKSKDYIERHLKDILIKLNITDITMHSLRHTFITRCSEQNIPLYIIQSWVGHQQGSQITTKIYTHKQKESELKFINKFNNSQNYTHIILSKENGKEK